MIKVAENDLKELLVKIFFVANSVLGYKFCTIKYIYLGDEALDFVSQYYNLNKNKKSGGVFLNSGNLNEKFHDDFKKNKEYNEMIKCGIVCVIDCKLTTLVHEVIHAIQYQTEDKKYLFDAYSKDSKYKEYYKK